MKSTNTSHHHNKKRHQSTTTPDNTKRTKQDNTTTTTTPQRSALQQKFHEKLQGSRFRMLNETLYDTTGSEALQTMSRKDFEVYHEGYRTQVSKWPENPVDVIIAKYLRRAQSGLDVGDFGCGDAQIAKTMARRHRVHSFDLITTNPLVVRCDIAHVPLDDETLDMAIYSLSLMGKNTIDFLMEAHRVLRVEGRLVIAEVKSRFVRGNNGDDGGDTSPEQGMATGLHDFVSRVQGLGFHLIESDVSNKMFVIMVFVKKTAGKGKVADEGKSTTLLKPIPYKRR